jgi:hypothetical protein
MVLLGDCSIPQLSSPSACPGWSAWDIVLHLLGVDISNLSRRRDDHRVSLAPFAPADADFSDWSTLVAALNAFNEHWVSAARLMSRAIALDLLEVTGTQIAAYWRTLDPLAKGGVVSWAGPDAAPMWLDIAREYTEQWVHQAQIREAVGARPLDDAVFLEPVLATFVRALPRALKETAAEGGTSVRLRISGPAGGAWLAELGSGGWILGLDDGRPATASVELPQSVAWRLFTRGCSPTEARAAAAIQGRGDLASAVLETVAIIA